MTLPIVCAIDRNYALPLAVMLTSLIEHLRPSYRLLLYLLHRGANQDIVASIAGLVETRVIVPGRDVLTELPKHGHFPPEACYPLVLPEVLPESIDRVLFLDADLLVLDDVARLWETPMGNHALAAAPDAAIPFCYSRRGVKKRGATAIAEDATYFNCGVMLINLDAWRKREVTQRAQRYLRRVGRHVDFLHQEALNAVLWDDCVRLDSRWNLLAGLAGRRYQPSGCGNCQNPGAYILRAVSSPGARPSADPSMRSIAPSCCGPRNSFPRPRPV